MKDTPTPETDAFNAKQGLTHAQYREFTRKLERQRDAARIPICIGPPIIGILAAEGQWVSENGNAVIAADGLFRQDPYERIKELERREDILVAALSEIKATIEGKSTQPVEAIINGTIAELRQNS